MGGPRLQFMAGRANATQASPSGLVPKPEDPIDMIIDRFDDAGFTPNEIVDLLASHSVAAQDTIDPVSSILKFHACVTLNIPTAECPRPPLRLDSFHLRCPVLR